MDRRSWDPAGEDKGYHQERAKTSFSEELLRCYRCGKIYFSKRPIHLPMLSGRHYSVCLECSYDLECSMCGKDVSPSSALAVENLQDSEIALLCPRCKGRILSRFRVAHHNVFRRFCLSLSVLLMTSFDRIRSLPKRVNWRRAKTR